MRYDLDMKLTWVLLLLSACASREWRTTVKSGTSEAYSAYVAKNPGTLHASVAERRAEDRGWVEADFANTSTAYSAFLAAWPASEHAPEALVRAEALGWEEAVAENTIASFSAFASRYPTSAHLAEANTTIEELWYAESKYDATETSWSRYLVRYPEGKHVVEATQERDRLVWTNTVLADTRIAYQRYVDRFPTGAHVTEARLWLAETYVTSVQVVVALIGSWQPADKHEALLGRIKKELDTGFVAELKRDFEVLPTVTFNGTRGFPHPQDQWGVRPDTGIIVVEYTERKGRKFDPSGNATDIIAVVRLYVPSTKNAVYARELEATTPEKVQGSDLTALNTGAIVDLDQQLRYLEDEIAKNRRGAP